MIYKSLCVFFFVLMAFCGGANNVKIKDLSWNVDGVENGLLKMTFTVSWDNSWRDDYNHDAVYVFFKYKYKSQELTSTEIWNHMYLLDEGNGLYEDVKANPRVVSTDFAFWLSPLSQHGLNVNTGIYIYRNTKTAGMSKVDCEVVWDITKQLGRKLTADDIANNRVLISAQAIEMVYVPYGPYYIGDDVSANTFRNTTYNLPEKYDLVHEGLNIVASGKGGDLAADHLNDNTATSLSNLSSAWVCGVSEVAEPWWRVDFGKKVKVTYFGVNGSKLFPNDVPTEFVLEASNNKESTDWPVLWSGPGLGNWRTPKDAYPIEKAIRVELPPENEGYQYYRIRVKGLRSGSNVIALSIGMTDRELAEEPRQCVLIDGKTTKIDTTYGLWSDNLPTSGTIDETYPNGYKGFYVMKYELSQEQYVRFLNKLTLKQQQNILGTDMPNILNVLNEGNYVFGDMNQPSYRNSIIVATKIDNMPVVFANNLLVSDDPGQENDGQNIACNYMSISDMLAYADWACLRPLSEMEYEKMSRRLYPKRPVNGECAWNTQQPIQAKVLKNDGSPAETATQDDGSYANVNYGGALEGPIRVGAFATSSTEREKAGASFWGVMDLSGNLAEMYYNVNNKGLNLYPTETGNATNHTTAHGDGFLSEEGKYNGCVPGNPTSTSTSYRRWQEAVANIAFRGGSFSSEVPELATSDRSRYIGFDASKDKTTTRDSALTFRLGRSYDPPRRLESVLTLQNEKSTREGNVKDTICSDVKEYTIEGNKPSGITDTYVYIWYIREEKGEWHVLEGANDRDLTYRDFKNNTKGFKSYEFKRRVVTTDGDSHSHLSAENTVTIVMDQASKSWINSLRDTIFENGKSKGGFYVKTDKPSTFKWYWVKNDGTKKQLKETFPGQNGDTAYYSHYVPVLNDFKDDKGNIMYGVNRVRQVRVSSGMSTCELVYDMEVLVKEDKNIPTYVSDKVPCGGRMVDVRDGQKNVYNTIRIGNQCWMTENLRNTAWGATWQDRKEFGQLYCWTEANVGNSASGIKQGICPEGWLLPDRAAWQTLKDALEAMDPGQPAGKHLKASKYWTFHSDENLGDNRTYFGAVPAGYYWGSSAQNYKNIARLWTSERNGNNGYFVQLDYNTNELHLELINGNNWYGSRWESYSVRCFREITE